MGGAVAVGAVGRGWKVTSARHDRALPLTHSLLTNKHTPTLETLAPTTGEVRSQSGQRPARCSVVHPSKCGCSARACRARAGPKQPDRRRSTSRRLRGARGAPWPRRNTKHAAGQPTSKAQAAEYAGSAAGAVAGGVPAHPPLPWSLVGETPFTPRAAWGPVAPAAREGARGKARGRGQRPLWRRNLLHVLTAPHPSPLTPPCPKNKPVPDPKNPNPCLTITRARPSPTAARAPVPREEAGRALERHGESWEGRPRQHPYPLQTRARP